MSTAIIMAVLHGAAGSFAQTAQGPPGWATPVRVYLVPRPVPVTLAEGERPVPLARPPDQVIVWNEAALEAIKKDRTPPPLAARNLAMVHVAVYDAVNSVQPLCRPYGIVVRPPRGTSAEAAAA